jgi:tRNA pseudouridine38-40 synthase
MKTYKLVIAYDGTDYYGWQRQPDKETIQGIIEKALERINNKKINLIGSGRTDAGVHAQGQVAHFKARISLSENDLFRALNSIIPDDIRILSLKNAPESFHARKSAKSKIYKYRILNSSNISPYLLRYVLQWSSPLDTRKMEEAALLFQREGDFTPFSSNRLLNPVRFVTSSEIKTRGKEIIYTIESSGFLRYMVRTIVGTLLEVGREKMRPSEIDKIFKKGRRSLAGPTAAAKGLCLVKVKY